MLAEMMKPGSFKEGIQAAYPLLLSMGQGLSSGQGVGANMGQGLAGMMALQQQNEQKAQEEKLAQAAAGFGMKPVEKALFDSMDLQGRQGYLAQMMQQRQRAAASASAAAAKKAEAERFKSLFDGLGQATPSMAGPTIDAATPDMREQLTGRLRQAYQIGAPKEVISRLEGLLETYEPIEAGFRQASAEEAASFGVGAGQFGPDGRFYPVKPPSGLSVQMGPDGGFSLNQGPLNQMPSADKPSKGFQRRYDPSTNSFVDEAIPGSDPAKEREASAEKARLANANLERKSDAFNSAIDRATDLLETRGRWVAGYGSILSGLPESGARDFQAVLDTVKANLGFDELQAMRDSSPTGGALGQVTERELGFLQSVEGNLDAAQSPDQLLSILREVKQRKAEFAAERNRIISGGQELNAQSIRSMTDQQIRQLSPEQIQGLRDEDLQILYQRMEALR